MYELLPLYRKVFRAEGRASIYYDCCYSKARIIIQGVSPLDYSLFSSLWPGGKFCRITTNTSRFRNSLYPQTAWILNCQSNIYWQTNWTASQHYKMSIIHTNNAKQILNNLIYLFIWGIKSPWRPCSLYIRALDELKPWNYFINELFWIDLRICLLVIDVQYIGWHE